ncbi:unnamed protein product [Brachionus calyciflorus]|uniref:Uncharacterized protein n=1 Tax=Brachionus calyciflorus TaxID=104777 RepID=A0A814ERW3_9BILA|nr:unnamed protein product [Brachionus calyciflorus]
MEEVLVSQDNAAAYKINHFSGDAVLSRRRFKTAPFENQPLIVNSGSVDDHYKVIDRTETSKTIAYRPMTSNAFRIPFNLSDPIGESHYDSQYYHKTAKKEEPIRTGTASGFRSNNPHPSKEFMVFRFRPLKPITNSTCDWSRPIGDKLISQVIGNQMKSTYATDYVNNVEEKAKFEERARQITTPSSYMLRSQFKSQKELDQKNSIPEFQYNDPFTYESMYISPNRYASNLRHQDPAVGIVPGCSRFWKDYSRLNRIN